MQTNDSYSLERTQTFQGKNLKDLEDNMSAPLWNYDQEWRLYQIPERVFTTSEMEESFKQHSPTFKDAPSDLSNTHIYDLWWWETAISTSGRCELQVVRSVAPLWLVLLQETGQLMNGGKLSVQAKMIQFPLSGGLLLQKGKKNKISDMKDLLLGTERTSIWKSSVWECTTTEVKEFKVFLGFFSAQTFGWGKTLRKCSSY